MSIISAEEWEVLGFFGVNPKTEDETPWPYNDFLYEVARGNNSLSCAIAPAYKDVRIILKCDDVKAYELNAVAVKDVGYIEEANGKEVLEITLSDKESIRIVINPNIEIDHVYENAT